ncbi:anti-sigma factor family protein [Ectobacillus ponti]|uniref:Zinc-finger domain-containing protein n=1 Tax=Ectobacillus ponti TaxID=2961894 RepID=A0AA41X7Q6_9BACI|nr:hypothetical protein [Ectobacillus ponti]MCP8968194.1 hypothetical protein [Ectobacillus ponti]
MKHLTIALLTAYSRNELPQTKRHLCEQHLQQCTECLLELDMLRELQAVWSHPDQPLPEHTFTAIMADIQAAPLPIIPPKQQPSRKVSRVHVLLAAAAAFLFLQSGILQLIPRTDAYVERTVKRTSFFADHKLIHWMEGTRNE